MELQGAARALGARIGRFDPCHPDDDSNDVWWVYSFGNEGGL